MLCMGTLELYVLLTVRELLEKYYEAKEVVIDVDRY